MGIPPITLREFPYFIAALRLRIAEPAGRKKINREFAATSPLVAANSIPGNPVA
jgi:hypothetical protein